MPSWSEILTDIQKKSPSNPNYLNELRKQYLNKISSITGRNVISYYSAWLRLKDNEDVNINESDKNAFMNAVYGMDRSKGLDLILHTPGGDIAATEGIVTYLKYLFHGDIRAIVPQISMSAGTMIAMSCKEIIMGRQSSLGPIDPQMGGVACQAVVDEFYRAVEEVKKNPASLGLWQTIIGKYHPTFLTACEDAVKWSQELAEKWLTAVNPDIDVEKFNKVFINHNHSYSHSRRISYEDCLGAGLNVKCIEDNQDLQDAVLSLHHCYMISMDMQPIIKIVENQNGSSYINLHSVSKK